MAGTSLLALIDDIATTLDDVAVLTKVAAKKTSGVLGDDLALNAEQVAGVNADRELPVVFAVAKGSFVNKVILVPSALVISMTVPVAIIPMLMVGGAYLCFEGFEKVYAKIFHKSDQNRFKTDEVEIDNIIEFEKSKIKGAIRTDFILSAEIVVITLGTVSVEPVSKQAIVLSSVALLMTIGVYGLVAAIVKLDDMGLHLIKSQKSGIKYLLGKFLLLSAPLIMKFLGQAGTVAMFLVGGSIVVHNLPALHHYIESMNVLLTSLFEITVGVVVGGIVLLAVSIFKKIFKKKLKA